MKLAEWMEKPRAGRTVDSMVCLMAGSMASYLVEKMVEKWGWKMVDLKEISSAERKVDWMADLTVEKMVVMKARCWVGLKELC